MCERACVVFCQCVCVCVFARAMMCLFTCYSSLPLLDSPSLSFTLYQHSCILRAFYVRRQTRQRTRVHCTARAYSRTHVRVQTRARTHTHRAHKSLTSIHIDTCTCAHTHQLTHSHTHLSRIPHTCMQQDVRFSNTRTHRNTIKTHTDRHLLVSARARKESHRRG